MLTGAMTQDRFQACLAETLKWEGGWSNHPKDPGGATMKGVIQKVYDAYRERKGVARQSVRNISENELLDIYRANYWWEVKGDSLPAGLDLEVFDFGVNSGPTRAVRYLQACLGIPQDGHMGDVTVRAASQADADGLLAKYMTARRGFLRSLKTYPTFGKGWERRCRGIEAVAVAAAAHPYDSPAAKETPVPLPDPDKQSDSQGRAVSESAPVSGKVVGAAAAVASGAAVKAGEALVSGPPPGLTETATNIGLWQSIGQTMASFGQFVWNNPIEVAVIATVVAGVWYGPRLLPVIWSRQS